jgi:lipopolysaccharide transport system permease protein
MNNKWDTILTPKSSFFTFNLSSVWKYRDLLILLVRRDFVAFYKQTILGPIWFFIQPLFTTLTYFFIFSKVAALSTDGIPPILFYLTGIATWNYFSECLIKTSTVFRENANIFGKVYFPRLIMPLSIVASGLLKFAIQLLLLLLLLLYYNYTSYKIVFTFNLFYLPFLIILMAIQALGLGMLVSAITTKYRDLSLLLNFGVQLLLYATTVAYPLSSLDGNLKFYISLNPTTYLIEGIRKAIYGIGEFNYFSFLYLLIVSIAILFIGLISFNKVERNFIDTI